MSKHDDKVIPTLDDVIQAGDLSDTQIGDLSALDDDFDYPQNDTAQTPPAADDSDPVELANATELDDDSFDDAFDKLVAEAEQAAPSAGDLDLAIFDDAHSDSDNDRDSGTDHDIDNDTIQLDPYLDDSLDDSLSLAIDDSELDDIAEQIVAERFPAEAAPAVTATPKPPAPVQAAAKKPAPVPPSVEASASSTPSEIKISQLVDDITRQLMPEIEWKIRTHVRDILEQYFPDKD